MSKLRIAWLTPWNVQSAIARSAFEVALELERRGHEVTVFRTETGGWLDIPALPARREIHTLAHWTAPDIHQRFDVTVAQIGDHFGFHGGMLSKLHALDVVGVFHDAFLANLAYGWVDGNEPALRELTTQTHGADSWAIDEHYLHDLGEVMKRRPMLEWVARHTVAAVAHAEHYAPRLRGCCPGPVAVIPLAFTFAALPPPPSVWDRLTVATVGHANANKRIDQVILAIAASHVLRSRCRVKVIGSIADAERLRLERLARTVGTLAPVFTGWVPDEELPWQLRDVDVVSCLRNPVLEGASASLVLAMCSRRPTLVTDHGCYAELPGDLLMKCSPEHEAVDVMRHLERLVRDPERFRTMGEKAHDLAVHRHAPAAYVDALLPLLDQVVQRRPGHDAGRSLADTLAGFGLGADDPAAIRARDVLAHLLEKQQFSR